MTASNINPDRTALVLIGYQNDYFAPDGVLRQVVDSGSDIDALRQRTIDMLSALKDTGVTLISTPILFTPGYEELVEPVGILEAVRAAGAFQNDSEGGATISEIEAFGDAVLTVPGKRGLNAFAHTDLHRVLQERQVEHVVLAGVVTSICVDSTGRSAHERGYSVTVLSDCTGGRTVFEQDFYCGQVFPLYADVTSTSDFISEVLAAGPVTVGA